MKKAKQIVAVALILIFTVVAVNFISQKSLANQEKVSGDTEEKLANAVVLYVGSSQAYVNNKKVNIDNDDARITPLSVSGKTLVPVRFISQALGAKVEWNQKTKTVTILKDGKVIKLVMGQKAINTNGKVKKIDVAVKTINNSTYVPFRDISEAFGKKVFYDRGLIIISDKDNIFNPKTDKTTLDKLISMVNNLPVVGTEAKFKELLKKAGVDPDKKDKYKRDSYFITDEFSSMATANTAMKTMAVKESAQSTTGDSSSSDFSKTNVQVEGVDEADVVKTDGKYIYQVNNNKVVIADVMPANKMKVIDYVYFTDSNFRPQEMYIDDNRMVVIGSTYKNGKSEITIEKSALKKIRPDYYYPTVSYVKAVVLDITDRSNAKKVRDFEIEGNYVSSRKINSALYIISNKSYGYYLDAGLATKYIDTAEGSAIKELSYEKMYYFPQCERPNSLIVAGIDINKDGQKADITSYFGSGDNVYASLDNLYVSINNYYYGGWKGIMPQSGKDSTTTVYKFSLNKGKVTYLAKGEVPGTILNQFSMDESNGYFRIATTVGHVSRGSDNSSDNNLYILNDSMSIVGKIEAIAPGERIYSVRFMGDRAYIVTFKKIDPLFVIDLKNPAKPKILGKLKIPGYSDYLHPYDENHIIGFGKDTIEAKEGTFAWYQGMKIAMFDVTDVENPKEMFKEIIGDRGTESELLYNHKALLFSKEKNLMAFPVTVMTIENKDEKMNDNQYGTFEFQGAYVYNVDLKNGFKLKGRISHIPDEEYKKAGNYWYDSYTAVDRVLYISDNLYTLSRGKIQATSIKTMKKIGSLIINAESNP